MKKVSLFGVISCAGVGFSVVPGHPCEVPAEDKASLIDAGYAVEPKKGITLASAREIAEANKAAAIKRREDAAAAEAEAQAAAEAEAQAAAEAEAPAQA
ncbi:MAG: hypothetical protein IE919_10045 [Thioclava sp.]|nr:hypothetical protein [Thioclava sp.]MBD3803565.1 hypothetical protein [Thioclava sp.]